MNLIEQLGGYERAKHEFKMIEEMTPKFPDEVKTNNRLLLEYRREHNIFEVGDKVVLVDLRCSNDIWCVSESSTSDYVGVIKEGMLGFSVIHKLMIRHATNEEIKVGHRL